MDSSADASSPRTSKLLGSLGRDEMNLAEFPITLLTDRVPKDQKEAVYQDELFDERSGLTVSRKLTIRAGTCGLTTAIDDQVILALIQLTRSKNHFTERKLEFSRYELTQLLGWSLGGASYERIKTSLDRWTSVYLQYENAWRDNRTKTWRTIGFHIIDKYEINDGRNSGDPLDLLPSHIIWNDVIFESFQAGYLKPLDYDLCMGLSNSTAKRMYRFLDKRFHHRPDWLFDLKEFAHEHIGLGRHYEGPAHLKRNLMPAIDELEAVGFLEPMTADRRFFRDGKDWKVRLIQKGSMAAALPAPAGDSESQPPVLAIELTNRGVTKATAEELVQKHPADLIGQKIDVFDWLAEKKDKRITKSPEGYLCESIRKDYATPKGFISRAERQARKEAEAAREREKAEAKRHEREEEERARNEKRAINAYWQSLMPVQQAELDAVIDAQADAETLAAEQGPLQGTFRRIRRHAYIRQLLENRERTAFEA
jgi:Replication initiator protein A